MNKKEETPPYNPNYILELKETLPIFPAKFLEKVELFFFDKITLYPKEPTYLKFYYIPPKDSLSEIYNYSIRLDEDIIKRGIYQYNPGLDTSKNPTTIRVINCSNKKQILKKGDKLGIAQVYLENYLKLKKYKQKKGEIPIGKEFMLEQKIGKISDSNSNSIIDSSEIYESSSEKDINKHNKEINSNLLIQENNIGSNKTLNLSEEKKAPNLRSSILRKDNFFNNEEKKNSKNKETIFKIKETRNDFDGEENINKQLLNVKRGRRKRINKIFKKKNKILSKNLSDSSKDYSEFDFDLREKYLSRYKSNSSLDKKKELLTDLDKISKKFSLKSKISFDKIKNIEKNCYSKKGKRKKKLLVNNIESNIKELILLKEEEMKYLKISLQKIWKKVKYL